MIPTVFSNLVCQPEALAKLPLTLKGHKKNKNKDIKNTKQIINTILKQDKLPQNI